MGKLAERFTDVNRSGVYRVRAADVPRAAAAEARARLVEVAAPALGGEGWGRLQQALGGSGVPLCVLLVSDAPALDALAHERMVAALRVTAQAWREAGRAFFAVLVDPDATLPMPPLYHERPLPGRNE